VFESHFNKFNISNIITYITVQGNILVLGKVTKA